MPWDHGGTWSVLRRLGRFGLGVTTKQDNETERGEVEV